MFTRTGVAVAAFIILALTRIFFFTGNLLDLGALLSCHTVFFAVSRATHLHLCSGQGQGQGQQEEHGQEAHLGHGLAVGEGITKQSRCV